MTTSCHVIVTSFKEAMSMVAASVAIITCLDEDEGAPAGATVSSFTSVSLDPPMILVCLNRDSHTLKCLRRSKQFAENVLRNGQADTAARFAASAQRNKKIQRNGPGDRPRVAANQRLACLAVLPRHPAGHCR